MLNSPSSYKTVYRRVQRPQEALDAPRPQPKGPVEIDELYVKVAKKGRERNLRPAFAVLVPTVP
jgi:hypothetical protein